LRQIVRWEPELRYPSEEDLETFEERMRIDMIRVNEGLSRERLEQLLQRQRERMRVDSGEPFPLFGRLIPDGEGGIWLSDYAIVPGVDGLADWSVITADGTWQGRVTLPDRFRILDVRRDRVLGVHRDSMDVESLAVYRILSEPVPR
jgi:hypothetical protein